MATHLGQSPSNHVTLELVGGVTGGCGPAQLDFVRVLPNGQSESGPGGRGYRVPSHLMLIITDVDWQYVAPDRGVSAGKMQVFRLFVENLADTLSSRRVFESPIVLSAEGEGGASVSMTSGFVVSPAARICPDVVPGPSGPPFGIQHAILRGYLSRG